MPKLRSGKDTSRSAESLSEDLLECCRSELLSEEALRTIIKRHGLTPDNDNSLGVWEDKVFFAACWNSKVTEGIIRCLLEYFPNAASAADEDGWSPLHCICDNPNVTLNIIRLIVDVAPDSVSKVNNIGAIPLHYLCANKMVDEAAAIQILKLFMEKDSDVVQHADNGGSLPIHIACVRRSPEFCRVLIDAAPASLLGVNNKGGMPLHCLCDCTEVDEAAAIEILKFLLEKNPETVRHVDEDGDLPIHLACVSKSPEFCQVLIDAAPDSVRSVNNEGNMPLHYLCRTLNTVVEGRVNGDGETARQTLKLLLEKYPESVQCADNDGDLPIHLACLTKSPDFCRVLFEAYPGSERITDANGALPLHWACMKNTIPTVEYVHNLYPDAIHRSTTDGLYPIHDAIRGANERGNPADFLEIVKFLLGCDPDVKLQKYEGISLLFYACEGEFDDTKIEAGIQIIDAIYGAHPEAIDRVASDIHHFHPRVQEFLNRELVYARQAKDHSLITTPDENGQLPLHMALQNDVTLGSIKLLVKGNPPALLSPDNSGALPIHIACQHHDSADVVKFFVELDTTSLGALDKKGNTALHYACRGAKYDTIALLLERYDAVSVSKRNAHDELPIDLLWESNEVSDRESLEYMDIVFQLVRAYPEMIAISNNLTVKQPVDADATRNGKKRKICHGHEEQ